ncbi:isoform X1, partial [Sarracenia purpurea var. burkii]
MENRRIISTGIEVNTMAILDASGYIKGSQDLSDDRIAFLEAVRFASLVPDNGIAPT